jgi:hypothetical protein
LPERAPADAAHGRCSRRFRSSKLNITFMVTAGFAVVKKGKDKATGQAVAIKVR